MKIHKGMEVLELAKHSGFIGCWNQLVKDCPWATVFQQKEFVLTWYELFSDQTPFMITDWNGDSMTGLFSLIEKDGQLSYPGNNLAEYQVWISTPESNTSFIKEALELIQKEYTLSLKYIPSGTPLDWVSSNGQLKNSIFLKEYPQPVMQCDEEHLEKELRKKNKKEKINRLKRQGELSFERVISTNDFNTILPNLVEQNEFRKGAIYGKLAFLEDPRRVDFLSRVFEKKLLHASILKLDNKIIASNVGFITSETVHLQGLNTHSPFYAKYSPGILHFLMLGIHLKKENYRYFDLTPGGADGYKSNLATSYYTAHEMQMDSVYATKKNKVKDALKRKAKTLIGKHSKKASVLSNLFSTPSMGIGSINPGGTNTEIYLNIKGHQFSVNADKSSLVKAIPPITYKKNDIADLLNFPLSTKRTDFLSDAMYRIENGQVFYAITGGDQLFATLWYIPTGTKDPEGNNRAHNHLEFSYLAPNLENPQSILNGIIKDQGLSRDLVSKLELVHFKSSLLE
ncbi:GNAT family N-acetyltransferase [Echinicola soli]|uniref:GNAT family N-acetyltransferase n=1 Tax=Echinicola soli TaxID=2591634 RepID=A0A514CJX6_9BACT|nr:GNAT family N-acetyltransferase [Echinicola soli]QDH80090.1 GNAT family N-acetyltransferase [Echinicola soli]